MSDGGLGGRGGNLRLCDKAILLVELLGLFDGFGLLGGLGSLSVSRPRRDSQKVTNGSSRGRRGGLSSDGIRHNGV